MSMPAALARRRTYVGPAIFSYGFRPFFFGGALWSALAILLWVPQYVGFIAVPSAIAPLDWHIHEMLFGFVPAIVAGFLLTAIPNWTGRLPVCGAPLAGLAALWLAGRVAMLSTAGIGLAAAAVIDVAFLLALAAVALREIIAGKNWRNLRVLAIVAVLIAGNIAFHIETIRAGSADYGTRLGIGSIILLIALIGGRIIPSFTHNWLSVKILAACRGRSAASTRSPLLCRRGRLPAGSGRRRLGRPVCCWYWSASCMPSGCPAGRAIVPSATRSFWFCMWPTPSFRSGSS
jgi:uncharacterized protein involved in response to NO